MQAVFQYFVHHSTKICLPLEIIMIYTTSEDISLSIQTKVITQENILSCSLTKIQEKIVSVVWEINTLLLNYICNNFSIQTFTSQ